MNEFGLGDFRLASGHPNCHVLVVDDDGDCLEEYSEIVDWLGYRCVRAGDARSALRILADDPRIGIVVTDLQMPGMDGISFLDELSARYSPLRPIVALVVTGYGSMDRAVEAMRHNAVDFLAKPITREDFAEALRRASRRWTQLVADMRLAALAKPEEAETGGEDEASGESEAGAPTAPDEMLGLVRSIVRSRQRRSDYLDSELFADPAWDILLDLTSAALEGKVVPVSSACVAANVPMTTALRYIRHLVDAGLIKRWKDPTDARRYLLELEDGTLQSMKRYITEIGPKLAAPKN